jgi:hypothetical protein
VNILNSAVVVFSVIERHFLGVDRLERRKREKEHREAT